MAWHDLEFFAYEHPVTFALFLWGLFLFVLVFTGTLQIFIHISSMDLTLLGDVLLSIVALLLVADAPGQQFPVLVETAMRLPARFA